MLVVAASLALVLPNSLLANLAQADAEGGDPFNPPAKGAAGSSRPHNLVATHSRAYFAANDGSIGVELFCFTPTEDSPSPTQVTSFDLIVGSRGSHPADITPAAPFSDAVFFSAHDAVEGRELFYYDGVPGPSVPVLVSTPGGGPSSILGSTGSHPHEITVDPTGSEQVYFTAWDGSMRSLFTTDSAGMCSQLTGVGGDSTALEPNGDALSSLSRPHGLTALADGRLAFCAAPIGAEADVELWFYDPTPGARELHRVELNHAAGAGSAPSELTLWGQLLFCAATVGDDGSGASLGRELAVVDTISFEVTIEDLAIFDPGGPFEDRSRGSDPSNFAAGLTGVAFTASRILPTGNRERELYLRDHLDCRPLPTPNNVAGLTQMVGGFGEFIASAPRAGGDDCEGRNSLWCVDELGATPVLSSHGGAVDPRNPTEIVVLGPDEARFNALADLAVNEDSWTLDLNTATAAPTDAAELADTEPSFPTAAVVLPGMVLMSRESTDPGRELFCDQAGSIALIDLYPGDIPLVRNYWAPLTLDSGALFRSRFPLDFNGIQSLELETQNPTDPTHTYNIFGIEFNELEGGISMLGGVTTPDEVVTFGSLLNFLSIFEQQVPEAVLALPAGVDSLYVQAIGVLFDIEDRLFIGTPISVRALEVSPPGSGLAPPPAKAKSKGRNDDTTHEYQVTIATEAFGDVSVDPLYVALVRCFDSTVDEIQPGNCTQERVLLRSWVLDGDLGGNCSLRLDGEVDLFSPMAEQDGESLEAHSIEFLLMNEPPTAENVQSKPDEVVIFRSYC